ncbi:MAG TPA: hypothetical protein VHM70_12790 [Polyangiaceae bacterium]|jgi:hypothetical protein|nr:hypothetical protein [Polyangiaceae bacterium]
MLNSLELLAKVREYLLRHPEEVLRVIKNAAQLRFGVPLEALRWAAGKARGKRAPKDVQIEAVPPGVRVGATIDLMGTVVRASCIVYIEDVRLSEQELRFEIRLTDVSLRLMGDFDTPVATLIKSGALDLSKPGNLVAFMPKRPKFLVEARDDRVVIDLMKHPALANQKVERIVSWITPFITLGAIRTDWEHLDFELKPFQNGVAKAFEHLRREL